MKTKYDDDERDLDFFIWIVYFISIYKSFPIYNQLKSIKYFKRNVMIHMLMYLLLKKIQVIERDSYRFKSLNEQFIKIVLYKNFIHFKGIYDRQ
jgi:hypothetical protein